MIYFLLWGKAIAADAERQTGPRPTWISEADALLCARLVRRYGERGLFSASAKESDAVYSRVQRDFSVNPFQLTAAQLRRLLQRFARAPDGVYARLIGHPPPISVGADATEEPGDDEERAADSPDAVVNEREFDVASRPENSGRVIQMDMA